MQIEIKNLSKKFNNSTAVENISFIAKKIKPLGFWVLMDVEKQLQSECC